jgi:hypothetical protein
MEGDQRSIGYSSRFLKRLVVWVTMMMHTSRALALVAPTVTRRLAGARTPFLAKFPQQHPTFQNVRNLSSSIKIMMAAVDEDEAIDSSKTLESTWDIPGLRREVARLVMRSHKKIAQASTRLTNANELVEKLTFDENATLGQHETCPDVDALKFELEQLRNRLVGLNELEQMLESEKKKSAVLPEKVAKLALDLGVNDGPPGRSPRGPTKKKGPAQEPKRLPYRRFYSINKTEIRVGKQAEDNDVLSLSPQHRDGSDWWMHASGCPGSHVVIRCGDENLDNEVVMDAAALAARQSKCQGSVIKVSLTRCRDVKKPPGAKAGLVQLTGRVKTVSVNMKEAESRLERLDKTVQVN